MEESKVVDVDGVFFEIIEEGDGDHVFINDEQMVIGFTDFPQQVIYLHKDIKPQVKKMTLMHELTHAFLFVRGFDKEEFNQEVVCDIMASLARTIVRMTDEILRG